MSVASRHFREPVNHSLRKKMKLSWGKWSIFGILLAIAEGYVHIDMISESKTPFEIDQAQERIRHNASQGQFPYQIHFSVPFFIDSIRLHFSGSLIAVEGTQAVLTSAFWLPTAPEEFPRIRMTAGELNLNRSSGLEQERRIGRVYIHPDYKYQGNLTVRGNIALIFPDAPFLLNSNVSPIPLPPRGSRGSEGNVTVTGWSRRILVGEGAGFGITNDLNYASLPRVERRACQDSWAEYDRKLEASEDYFCVGGGDIAACSDELGSPAVSDGGFLEGISIAIECPEEPESRVPRIFSQVAPYLDWIHQTVEDFQKSSL